MNKDEYVVKAVSKIKNVNAKIEVSTELESHIADRIQYYKEIGYDEETAAQKAVEHMGDPEAVSSAFFEIYPTVNVSIAVFATLLVVAVVFLFNLVTFFTVGDGKMGYGISEFLTLCCFIGLSYYGKNRYSRYICILPIFAYFLTFIRYARFAIYYKDNYLCSRIILAFFCLITGDLHGLASFPNVGGIKVAPWLTYITWIFYGIILFVLLASFISACKLCSPQYGLFHKRMGRRITFLQKCILWFSAIVVCISVPVSLISHVFGKNPVESLTNYEVNPHFDYIMIVQSNTPCSFDEINLDDVLLFHSDYDWSDYILFWNNIGESGSIIYDDFQDGVRCVLQEDVSVPCGNLMECTVRKETLQCQLNKKYVYIGFVKDRGADINKNNLSAFVTITEDDWQETASVGTVCAAVDQYNCVEIIIKEAEA
ncbi:MAG: permease prefix domain 1-containing protein [Candidatus Fimenecus sp.]